MTHNIDLHINALSEINEMIEEDLIDTIGSLLEDKKEIDLQLAKLKQRLAEIVEFPEDSDTVHVSGKVFETTVKRKSALSFSRKVHKG